MKIRSLIVIIALLLPMQAMGRSLPSLTGAVVDEARVLTPSQKRDIEGALRGFYAQTGKQIQLVIIKSLEGDVLENFAIRLGEKWKIGKKKTGSGVILLVAFKDRKIRIEVGEGLEGELTDAESGRIIRGVITPSFKQSNYAGGIALGLQSIAVSLGGNLKTQQSYGRRGRGRQSGGSLFYLFIC